MRRRSSALVTIGIVGALGGSAHAAPQWTLHGSVASGRQLAATDDGSVVHLISEAYVQLDGATVIVTETEGADGRQGALDFYPAIAVGDDGSVHVVTRHGGDFDTGHEIRYRRRAPAGGWDPEIVVGSPVARNYVVGVAVAPSGRVLVAHSRNLGDINSVMDVYEIAGGTANSIGSTASGWLRADSDYWLARHGNALVLASGEPGPSSPFHVAFAADMDGDVIAQWQASQTTHEGGLPRRGGPALHLDPSGTAFVLYGGESTIQLARHDATGASLGADTEVMGGLGTWHLSYGNGTVVASADGMRVLVVGLRNLDGDQTAAGSEILWAESLDAGASFGAAQPLGATTDGGEGRMRPRMLRIGDTVSLLYYDPGASAIALATASWPGDEPPGDDTTGGVDTGTSDATAGGDVTGGSDSGGVDTDGGATGGAPMTSGLPLPPTGGQRGGDTGCACRAHDDGSAPLGAVGWALGPWGLWWLGRRRRRR